MKRRLLIIAIFLLLGAVVNVAVAWGCAVFVDPSLAYPEPEMITVGPSGTFAVSRSSRPTCTVYNHNLVTVFLEGELRDAPHPETVLPAWARLPKTLDGARVSENYWFEARGWPMRCLRSQGSNAILEHRPPPGPPGEAESDLVAVFRADRWISGPVHGGLDIGLRPWNTMLSHPRVLPLRPIWPGFAINTLFYATLLWLFLLGAVVLRRFLRVRRGLCPKCAYPMGESSVCTECGITLPRRRRMANLP